MFPKRKMNTEVPYKTPNIRHKTGLLNSVTRIDQAGEWLGVKIDIQLVWWNYSPWHYHVTLEGFKRNPQPTKGHGWIFLRDYSQHPSPSWSKGTELDLCSFAAEDEAMKMCANRGIVVEKFSPFVRTKTY